MRSYPPDKQSVSEGKNSLFWLDKLRIKRHDENVISTISIGLRFDPGVYNQLITIMQWPGRA